jgi:hypothetical protein
MLSAKKAFISKDAANAQINQPTNQGTEEPKQLGLFRFSFIINRELYSI